MAMSLSVINLKKLNGRHTFFFNHTSYILYSLGNYLRKMSYSKWWNFQFQCKKYEPHPEGQLGLGKLLLCLRGPDSWTPELKLGSKSSLPPGLPGSPRPLPVPPPQGHHSTSLQAQPSLHNRRRSQNLSEGLLIGNQWTITENETKRHCHNWAMMYF